MARVVFIPGFMQPGEAWRPVVELIGTRHDARPLDFATDTLEGRIGEIHAALEPRAVSVGYSMGGRLALHAALAAPPRHEALVLVGASAGVEDAGERAARRAQDEALATWIEAHPIEDVVARWQALPVFATQPPSLVASQRSGRLAHDVARLAAALRSAGQGALEPLWGRLGALDVPVLAVAGELDPVYVDHAHHLAAALPRARAEIIPGAGHAPHLEAPEAFAALLGEFLDEHLPEGLVGDRDA